MKKLSIILSITLLLLSFSACTGRDNKDNTGENNNTTDISTGASTENSEQNPEQKPEQSPEQKPENTPFTEKPDQPKSEEGTDTPEKSENVPEEDEKDSTPVFLASAPDGYEIVSSVAGSEFYIFSTNGGTNFGVIDINGKVCAEPVYTTLGWCPWHNVLYAEPFPEGTAPVVLSEKYKIDVHYGHGGSGHQILIFDNNTQKLFEAYFDYDMVTVTALKTLKINTPYINYTGSTPISDDDFTFEVDALYDIISELAFGSAEYEFVNGKGSIINLGVCDFLEGFINGYTVICKDGEYGLVNEMGDYAAEPVYEKTITAFDSKAWVKKDGKWQVLELKKA